MPQVVKPCPITTREFHEHAKPLVLDLPGTAPVEIPTNMFDSGSFGWAVRWKKFPAQINGRDVEISINLQAVVVGSKNGPGVIQTI